MECSAVLSRVWLNECSGCCSMSAGELLGHAVLSRWAAGGREG